MNRRCVLVGPPLCGKRTLLTAFAQQLNLRIGIREINDRSLATVMHYTTLRSGSDVIEIATISGTPWSNDAWHMLLADATDAILILDLEPERESHNRNAQTLLQSQVQNREQIVILTKQDRAGVLSRDRVVELYDLQEFQIYVSTLQDPATEAIRKCIVKYETT